MNDKIFFAEIKASLFQGSFTPDQIKGIDAILAGWRANFLATVSIPQFAYCFATTYHETGAKMVPVCENLNYTKAATICRTWPSRFPTISSALGFVKNPRRLANQVYNGRLGNRVGTDDGWNFRGRGLPQITGADNYAKATRELRAAGILKASESFVTTPDLVLRPDLAVAILFLGMEHGWFTGVDLDRYIDDRVDGDEHADFINGRRIINGTERAELIAGYGDKALRALVKAGALQMDLVA